jgi:hypothetical protein
MVEGFCVILLAGSAPAYFETFKLNHIQFCRASMISLTEIDFTDVINNSIL